MIRLTWFPYPSADVASYRVYRSMIGFVAPTLTPSVWAGLTLQLRMNGGALQTIVFDGVNSVVDNINATLRNGRAYLSFDPAQFLLRSDVRTAPGSVEILGGTALPLLRETPRLITEKSEDTLLGTVTALLDPAAQVTFGDHDGVPQDWYAVTTVDSSDNESDKTPYRQPIVSSEALCVLEGIVADLQGARVPDATVTATLLAFPYSPTTPSHITLDPISTLSGPDGRYSLVLLQGAVVELEIPAIGFTQQIAVPTAPFAFVSTLLADDSANLPTSSDLGTSGIT